MKSIAVPENHESLKPRASACAKASLNAELERSRLTTVEERILAALGLKTKFGWLEPSARK
ncbi:MAG TPA: hypothetical protein DIT13_01710 [Verrucomicrobiales bacterium]|nr:hypothetical protein [Verrucomicrobiales bacterium]HRJ07512.1 hypothetical protein [Prosthecobacter sp.]HRK12758.1 hypothetical protein [Prosthecobacter sp.]